MISRAFRSPDVGTRRLNYVVSTQMRHIDVDATSDRVALI